MPYSDPMMDGVTIQRAGTRALERGVRTRDAFAAVEAVASTGTPAVVMTYWNLIEHYGPDRFARDLAAAGGAGRDHPRPDPGRGGGVAGGLRRARSGPDLPGLAVLDRRPAGQHRGRLPRLGLRHLGDGCDRRPGRDLQRRPRAGTPDPRRRTRRPGRGRARGLQRCPGPRGDRVRRRGHRRLRPGQDAAGRRGRRHAGRPERAARGGRRPGRRRPFRGSGWRRRGLDPTRGPRDRPRTGGGHAWTSCLPWISTAVRLDPGRHPARGRRAEGHRPAEPRWRPSRALPAAAGCAWRPRSAGDCRSLEIALGLLLVTGIATRAVAGATAVLFAVFVAAVASAAARGLSIDCGCFGGGGTVAPGQTAYTGEIAPRQACWRCGLGSPERFALDRSPSTHSAGPCSAPVPTSPSRRSRGS